MIARSSELKLQGCRSIKTPLFVPSFSSRGFEAGSEYSEVQELYGFASSNLGDVSLVSAYDIHHGHIAWNDIQQNHSEILIIDSGGYEAADKNSRDWRVDDLLNVLRARPDVIPSIYVSYDSANTDESIQTQIERAQRLRQTFANVDVDLLLRAECKSKSLDIAAIEPYLDAVSSFSIVGVTEKDLGASTRERMIAIRSLRTMLDSADIRAPIHIFGSLSPVTSILYFLMGAEIFDGLSWLRNHFVDYRVYHMLESYESVDDVDLSVLNLRKKRMLSNLDFLEALSKRASDFCVSQDWSILPNGEFCRDIINSMQGGA